MTIRSNFKVTAARQRLKNARYGFTIVELLIVIVIIGILAGIALNAYATAQAKARDTQRIAELKRLKKGLEAYYALNGSYPTCNGTNACNSTGFNSPGYGSTADLPVTPAIGNDPRNTDPYGYYYGRCYKPAGNNTFASGNCSSDFIVGARLETSSTGPVWYGWGVPGGFNYMDGGSQ